jgi:hypothetical protein
VRSDARPPRSALGLLVPLLLTACGEDAAVPSVVSLEVSPSSEIHFPAIGDVLQLTVQATDANGRVVAPDEVEYFTRDPRVASVNPSGLIQSIGDGETFAIVAAGSLRDSVRISVLQARDSLVLEIGSFNPILSLVGDAPFPLTCRVFDADGILQVQPAQVASATGTLQGTTCGGLTAVASGHDTLVVQAGNHQTSIPFVLAIRPVVTSDPALRLTVDSFPAGATPWAPTLIRNSSGILDLYVTAYRDAPYPLEGKRGNLHRLVSSDNGLTFRYDGVALRRNSSPCTLQDTGIENITVVARDDAPGWRMYFSAGGSGCYGWQVFSAVSPDERTWVKEGGIRIPNGGTVPPQAPQTPPWPAGEGMVVDQLPSGEWRMLVGSYERITPPENRFQITEWRSTDQLQWHYVGPRLTTRQVGAEARRSIYSPTIQPLGPGLERMYFTGDNLDRVGGQSRIYSAVSTDRTSWQLEGPVLAETAADYFYSSMVDGLLVFIRQVNGVYSLGSVRIHSR